jgi:hypothetical protein
LPSLAPCQDYEFRSHLPSDYVCICKEQWFLYSCAVTGGAASHSLTRVSTWRARRQRLAKNLAVSTLHGHHLSNILAFDGILVMHSIIFRTSLQATIPQWPIRGCDAGLFSNPQRMSDGVVCSALLFFASSFGVVVATSEDFVPESGFVGVIVTTACVDGLSGTLKS